MAKGQMRSNREKKKPKTSTKKQKNKSPAAALQTAGNPTAYKFEPSRSGGGNGGKTS